MNFFPRESGVLLHITSLPGAYGIGEIGPEAFKFIDHLSEMGQSLWQILPTCDTGSNRSPYTTVSAFANNPMLISFDFLLEDGYLKEAELVEFNNYSKDKVDYDRVIPERKKILDIVCNQFFERASEVGKQKYDIFCKENEFWLNTYSLFLSLKKIHKNKIWTEWENDYSNFNKVDIEKIQHKQQPFIQKLKIQQFLFYTQWQRLKKYANNKGIRIVGDIPIYISHDSADVWANPDLFKLNEAGYMIFQSGCPPDYFLEDGQVWGHPIYDWDAHEKSSYAWWISRFKHLFTFVDVVRIDHFNGFAKYWEIPMDKAGGAIAQWVKGPGEKLLSAVKRGIGSKPIIAEDLGEAALDSEPLKEMFNIPGMKILQMSFGYGKQLNGSIQELNQENIVVYTGTHDNDTSIGWFQAKPGNGNTQSANEISFERSQALELLGTDGSEINWDFISFTLNSKGNTAIIPLQDILGLDSTARMNIPGTIGGNWEWRFQKDQLSDELIKRMRKLTEESNRLRQG